MLTSSYLTTLIILGSLSKIHLRGTSWPLITWWGTTWHSSPSETKAPFVQNLEPFAMPVVLPSQLYDRISLVNHNLPWLDRFHRGKVKHYHEPRWLLFTLLFLSNSLRFLLVSRTLLCWILARACCRQSRFNCQNLPRIFFRSNRMYIVPHVCLSCERAMYMNGSTTTKVESGSFHTERSFINFLSMPLISRWVPSQVLASTSLLVQVSRVWYLILAFAPIHFLWCMVSSSFAFAWWRNLGWFSPLWSCFNFLQLLIVFYLMSCRPAKSASYWQVVIAYDYR